MQKTYVIGHVNPDTDSIASSISYAWLLSKKLCKNVLPARAGSLNKQTEWLLSVLDVKSPELVVDAAPRIADVVMKLDALTPDRPLEEAWAMAERTGTVVPVVNENDCPYGLITGMSLFSFLRNLIAKGR